MAAGENQYEFLAVHEDVVKRVLEKQPAEEELYDLAELFKVFGDSTRIRILHALIETELCVGGQSSVEDIEGCEAGEVPQGRQDYILFIRR